jgi:hypothetical protein
MQLTRFLHRNAVFYFLAILLLSILVFGTQYILRISAGGTGYMPLAAFHAVTTGLWCVLLVAQGFLVRRDRLDMHGSLGKVSYLLAPVVAFSIFWLSLDVLKYDGIQEDSLYILSVRAFLFIFFVAFLMFALFNKRRPDVHARWMICSAAILLDPILSRISAFLHPVPWTTGFHQIVAFTVMNLLVGVLAVADWRQGRKDVFPKALTLMLGGQIAALMLWDTTAFRSFAEWFKTIPLPVGY